MKYLQNLTPHVDITVGRISKEKQKKKMQGERE